MPLLEMRYILSYPIWYSFDFLIGVNEEEARPVVSHQASAVGTLAMWMCPIYWLNQEAAFLMDANALCN